MKSVQSAGLMAALLLLTALLLASHTSSAQSTDLKQRSHTAGSLSQEWSKRALEDLLSQLSLPEGEVQPEAELVSMVTGGAKMELERSVEPANNTPPRDRKAGCKNFYWKGFTSC